MLEGSETESVLAHSLRARAWRADNGRHIGHSAPAGAAAVPGWSHDAGRGRRGGRAASGARGVAGACVVFSQSEPNSLAAGELTEERPGGGWV